ncbi:metallophosphoesterase [Nocardia mexicana]|uniref:metallophosphoesterase n=1 Tax=Nocardia mexicana TaxID=279262 RepID=UPI0027D8DB87|nr:metallophosphoesterase [Nocardia mexicana]
MVVVAVAGIVVVVCLVALGMVGLHWYVWRRLVRDTTARGSVGRRVGTGVIVAGPLLLIGAFVAERAEAPFLLTRIISWPGYLWGALFVYLVLWLLAGELVRPFFRRWIARADTLAAQVEPELVPATGNAMPDRPDLPDRPAPVSRRLFVSRAVSGAAGLAAVATVGYGAHGVLAGPRVERLAVPLANLPRAGHGYRIAVVSDIHLGPILGRGFAERVVDTINGTQPDLIAVVGDLVDGSVEHLRSAVEPLSRLRARHGAYFVTGNHEYFAGAEQWIEHVQDLGLRLLANSRTELPHFDLAGVNDMQGESIGQGPDFAAALGDRDPARTAVLLAHQPVQIHDAVEFGVDLQLSGHTHGGQIWPGNLLAGLANPTVAGLERYGDTQLYVTRGAGAWGPPVRIGAPSDITVIELASKQT